MQLVVFSLQHSYDHHYRVGMFLTSVTESIQEGDTPINWAVESIMEAGAFHA
jgi:hypothetical protein